MKGHAISYDGQLLPVLYCLIKEFKQDCNGAKKKTQLHHEGSRNQF
jgi:hypothetical protein